MSGRTRCECQADHFGRTPGGCGVKVDRRSVSFGFVCAYCRSDKDCKPFFIPVCRIYFMDSGYGIDMPCGRPKDHEGDCGRRDGDEFKEIARGMKGSKLWLRKQHACNCKEGHGWFRPKKHNVECPVFKYYNRMTALEIIEN